MLIGRDRELGQIAALLGEARRGRSGALAIVGEPGVGKTALLEEARRQAADLRVLAGTGVEIESELPYANLHELLRPLLALLPRIPASQARALAAALALEDGEPDALAVGAGTLSLLVEAAEEAAVLVLLDDAHWLDSASSGALLFAARRVRAEQIAVLVAYRGSSSVFDPLPRLELEPLGREDARRLLRERTEPVSAADETRVLAAAAGNPLALLELPVELAHELPSSPTAHERLQRAFSQRLDALPAESRLGLLLAAAEPETSTVRRAAEIQRLEDPLSAAEVAGLIRAEDGALTFRHPVVRSLVYAEASAGERAAAHRALADALATEADRDRRAWHLGASAEGPDEVIAALLEQTAERAITRGGHAAAARALERAARLSPDRAERVRRLYAASRSEYWGGDAAKAGALAEEALPLAEDPLLHADLLQQVHAVGEWAGAGLPETVFLRELERAGLDDDRRARLLYVVVKQRLDRFDANGAVSLAPELEQYARGASTWWQPRTLAGAAGAYLLAGERERAIPLFRELAAHPAMPAGFAYDYLALEWYDEVRASLAETLRQGRTDGNVLRIVWNQSAGAHLELRQGRLSAALAAAAEAIPLGELLGVPAIVGIASAALAAVHAWRGEADACNARARAAAATAHATGDRLHEGLAHQALGLLALGTGRPADAIVELEPLARRWARSTVVEPAFVPFVPDLIEGYALSGATSEARELLDRFAPLARVATGTRMLAACARCEGLLGAADDFDSAFSSGLELLEPSPHALELARTRLAYGERLRRVGRRREARIQLQAAHDAFAAVGATPWETRVAAELRATGVQVKAATRSGSDLTPQELHIAALVAEGKSNKEIAAAIYLSPKTVEYHLANTFRKLDIHSRAELARIFAQGEAREETPAHVLSENLVA